MDAAAMNAGISQPEYVLAEDESTITVNVISTFLLALLLLPKLQESAARYGVIPRLTIVGSVEHFFANTGDVDVMPGQSILDTLNDKKTANMCDR
jgi:retinol dehydrogenase 12